jgi:hypothetical protein
VRLTPIGWCGCQLRMEGGRLVRTVDGRDFNTRTTPPWIMSLTERIRALEAELAAEAAHSPLRRPGQPFDAEFDTPEESDEEASAAPSRMITATLNHTARVVSSGRSSGETVLLICTVLPPGECIVALGVSLPPSLPPSPRIPRRPPPQHRRSQRSATLSLPPRIIVLTLPTHTLSRP